MYYSYYSYVLDLFNMLFDPIHKTTPNNLFTNKATFYDAFMECLHSSYNRKGETNAIFQKCSWKKASCTGLKQHEE